MKKNNEPIKHHYIPQFLLRNFSCSSIHDEKACIYRYDKERGEITCNKIKDIGFKKSIYSITKNGITRNLETEFFKQLDYEASKIINEIISIENVKIKEEQKDQLLLFIAAQYLRVLKRLKMWRRLAEDFEKQLGSDYPFPINNSNLGEIKSNNDIIKTQIFTEFPQKCKSLADSLNNREIKLIKTQNPSFIISDNPICWINQYEVYELGTIPGDILLPITPNLLICVYMKENHSIIESMSSETIAKENNFFQVNEAERFIFSKDEKMLEKICKEKLFFDHPHILFEPSVREQLKANSKLITTQDDNVSKMCDLLLSKIL